MTPRETAAYNLGIRAAIDAALIAVITLETRDGSASLRNRAAVEALQGLATGLRSAFLDRPADPPPPCSRPCSEGT